MFGRGHRRVWEMVLRVKGKASLCYAQARELAGPAATPHEEAFLRGPGRAFRRAIAAFRVPLSSGFERCWDPFREVQRDLSSFLRQPTLLLPAISPSLAALNGSQIPMPGLAADHPPAALPPPNSASPPPKPSSPAALAPPAAHPTNATPAGDRDAVAEDGGRVCLESFGEEMAVLPTKTKPKKLLLRGTDGQEYTYLLKG